MTDVTGLALDEALIILGAEWTIKRAVPPRGLKSEEGVWRVILMDRQERCLTVALFPYPKRGAVDEHIHSEE